MTEEGLEKEAEQYSYDVPIYQVDQQLDKIQKAYLAGAEPREKRIKELENQNRLLGERCNQLLKDKGDLTDKIADIKTNCDLAIEGRDVKITDLERQIERMKCCGNCKHFDKLYNRCELTRLTLKGCLCNALDKWELRR